MKKARIQDFIPNSEIRIPNFPCPIGPPPSAEVERSLWEKGLPGRCFLRATPLPPGHKKMGPKNEGGQGHVGD